MTRAVIDGRIPQAHQLPVSFGKKYRSGKATSRNGTMNTPSTLVSGSTRSSRAIVTCVFYHARGDRLEGKHVQHMLTAMHMKMIQIRNVPEELHRSLKERAAREGTTLSDLILADLPRLAD